MRENCPFCARPMREDGENFFDLIEGIVQGEPFFEEDKALAALIAKDTVFVNAPHWKDDWPDAAKQFPIPIVNCNDVFGWACADGEPLPFGEIENLWRMWRKDPSWGSAVWCIQQRKQMPQQPVEEAIRAAGIWDLDAMGLRPNREITDE